MLTAVDEFAIIRRYFTRDADQHGVIVGIGDDGAILEPTPGLHEVQVIDPLVEGVHFPSNMEARDVGYRVVAVNLSDIAAMGAAPRWMTLALTLWDKDERWVEDFAAGLFEAASEHDVALVGGDTTQGNEVVASIHVTGEVEPGKALLRSGARLGDTVYVSGSTGDAAAGLSLFEQQCGHDYLLRRFLRPTARIELGRRLAGRANAAIDVSDGISSDLGHICGDSGVGALLYEERLPMSESLKAAAAAMNRDALHWTLHGGEAYVLLAAVDPDRFDDLKKTFENDGRFLTCIGEFRTGTDMELVRTDGSKLKLTPAGWDHFRDE